MGGELIQNRSRLDSRATENAKLRSRTVTLKAAAKLNLYLEVLDRRADGYHNLSSLFQMVGLYDRLSMNEAPEGIQLTIKGSASLDDGPSNLIVRAAKLLQAEMLSEGYPPRGANIHLEKEIPIASGMGGGSSDAAATLIGLNRLWSLGWSSDKLAELGNRIGSDLPFFFYKTTAWISGKGEHVEPIPTTMDGVFVLVHPSFSVSTVEVFAAYAKAREQEVKNSSIELTKPLSLPTIPSDKRTRPSIEEILKHPRNDLETVTFTAHSELKMMKALLRSLGGEGALMSGSGPTVFAWFKNPELADSAVARIKQQGHQASIAPVLKQSPFEAFL